jgi:hypothetical protein
LLKQSFFFFVLIFVVVHTAIEEKGCLKWSNHNEKDDGVPDGLWECVEAHPIEPDVDDLTASIEEVVLVVEHEHLGFSISPVSCLRAHHYFALVLQSLHRIEHGPA